MDKAYSKTNWQNSPSTSTALGATLLNKMENGIDAIDNRVVAMDTSKANASTVNAMVRDVTFNANTGVITITYQNGTTSTIDTAMEKIVTNFSYNSSTQKIDLTLADGTTQSIDISDFVTNVDFSTSNTIQFSVDGNGKTKAEIINGSITAEKMQSDYLADITVQAGIATTQANVSKRYAVGGVESGDTTDNAQYYKEQAELAKTAAETARDQAQAIVGIGIATDTTPGLVKGGGDVSINADGSMSVNAISDISEEPVTFTEAETDAELTTGSTLAILMGLIKKKFNGIVTTLSGKIGTDKIVNNLLSTDSTTVLSGPMGKALKEQLDTQNNNLAYTSLDITYLNGATGALFGIKNSILKRLSGSINLTPTATESGLQIGQLTPDYYPAYVVPFVAQNFSRGSYCNGYIGLDGKIYLQILSDAIDKANNYRINCYY